MFIDYKGLDRLKNGSFETLFYLSQKGAFLRQSKRLVINKLSQFLESW
jgi:hypothetical protein